MASIDAAIIMQLVDNDELQILEDASPLRVVRQDPGVQHVGIGEYDVGARPYSLARVLRSVAVISERPYFRAHLLDDGIELVKLILGESLGREQIKCARGRITHQRIEDRQIEAQCLAAGSWGDDDAVVAGLHLGESIRLVNVQLLDAAVLEHLAELRRDALRNRREFALASGHMTDRCSHRLQFPDDSLQAFYRSANGSVCRSSICSPFLC